MTPHRTHPQARARLELLGSVALFGLMPALARLASSRVGGFSAGQMSLVRFAVGGVLVAGWMGARPGTWCPVNVRLLVTRGLAGGASALLYFTALSLIPAGRATLLNALYPVLAVPLAAFTLRERPTLHLVLALALTASGVFFVLGGGSGDFRPGLGEALGLLSAFLGATAVTAIRALRVTDNAPTIFAFFTLGGLTASAPMAGGPWPGSAGVWALGLAVGISAFGAQMLMTHAYGGLTVAEAGVWQQLIPVASFAWATLLLGERVTPLVGLGVALGVAGVVYGTLLGSRPARSALRHHTPAARDGRADVT